MGTEEWRGIAGFPAYEVSSDGGIRRQDNARPLRVTPGSNGYPRVNLGDSGRDKLVHQLVMEAFAGPAPDGMEVRHLDGDDLPRPSYEGQDHERQYRARPADG
jgi:hypothetical protein